MKPDLFANLPSEVITNIFLRLSLRSIAASKCVCRPWLDLLEADEFVKSHFSKSAPALLAKLDHGRFKVLELEDELDLELEVPDLRSDLLAKFVFPYQATIDGCADGLLALTLFNNEINVVFVCNPITREFIKLDLPQRTAWGFGASKITGQHKVVCLNPKSCKNAKSECHIYTLGTGSWRRIEPNPILYTCTSFDCFGAFVNGNLHWVVEAESLTSLGRDVWICCFDIETECFSSFPPPPFEGLAIECLLTLSGCLCFYEVVPLDDSRTYGLVVWMIKEYEIDKSWTKEYVIPGFAWSSRVFPIKVFKNGDLLMNLCDGERFIYYSNKTKTCQDIGLVAVREDSIYVDLALLTPTLLSLRGLGMENVISV